MGRNKNAVIITASPRKNSGSKKAALFFAETAGLNPELIDINRVFARPCIACGRCADVFRCFQKDGVQGVIDKIKKASPVIIASPVYFTGVPGPLKIFIDRNQPVWEEYMKKKGGKKGARKKRGIIILTAENAAKKHFLPAERELRSLFAVHGIKTEAVIRISGAEKEGVACGRSVARRLEKAAGLRGKRPRGAG
ncbi:MAG TPA: flavodoxin family protein [bacterium]|nr:flavodoxin family protein [bacterium]